MSEVLFEKETVLPNQDLIDQSKRLVGFRTRFDKLSHWLRLIIDQESLKGWSRKFYKSELPLLAALSDRYPLVIFHGDVGTGKTAMAEVISNQLAMEVDSESTLFKLSTRVRGTGSVGQMSSLINQAFQTVIDAAGKKNKRCFLIIDEADSLAASRNQAQSHHEDKVAVNTLIQRIDDIRVLHGRMLIFLCTNRLDALDPAIIRRAAIVDEFLRPDETQRHELFQQDFAGMGFADSDFLEMVKASAGGGSKLEYTFSDLRTRLIPQALSYAFPNRKLEVKDIIEAVKITTPSPTII